MASPIPTTEIRPMLLLRPLIRFADFKGRASAAEYWLFIMIQVLFYGLCVVMAIEALAGPNMMAIAQGMMKWFGIAVLVTVLLTLPNYAAMTRRLHDTGRSILWIGLQLPAWFAQILSMRAIGRQNSRHFEQTVVGVGQDPAYRTFTDQGLPVHQTGSISPYGDIVPSELTAGFTPDGFLGLMGGDPLALAALTIGAACNLALFIMLVMPGQTGPNRFGPDPRNPDAVAPDPDGSSGYDEDRLEELFAQAKRDSRAAEGPYKPVFDFGPGPAAQAPAPAPRAVDWGQPAAPAWDPGVAPSRPFGRRG